MPRKRSTRMAEVNSRIDEAILALHNKQFEHISAVAKFFKVDRSTLSKRLSGRKTHAQAHESSQLFSKAEEDALYQWCKRFTVTGRPISHQLAREMATEILSRRVAKVNTADMQLVTYPVIGKDWTKRFFKRYPTLSTIYSRPIDFARWRDTTPEAINQWFDTYEDAFKTYRFETHNIYNMDETGFAIGTNQSNRVIVDSTLRTWYKVQPGRQEWVSIVECICADKTILPPLVIFKAASISTTWISESTPYNWCFSCSPKGWTSNKHSIEWLRQVFEPATRDKAMGKPRLLICDGHDSHISGNFIAHCEEHGIILLPLAPHTSHYTQPLDVAVFGPLATALSQGTDSLPVARISKAEWLELYIAARQKAFTFNNISSAWRGAGLVPIQRSKVLRHIPTLPTHSTSPSTRSTTPNREQYIFKAITSSPPHPTLLKEANTAFNSQVVSGKPLDSPARRYAKNLAHTSEHLAAQVTILRKVRKDHEAILNKRQKRRSGKRAALQGHFVLSTVEIRDKVLAAEQETARKKASQQRTRKRKRQETPSEDEGDTIESNSDSEISDSSDCIVVAQC